MFHRDRGRKSLRGRLRLAPCLGVLKLGSYPLVDTFVRYSFSLCLLNTSHVIETVQDVVTLSQIRHGSCCVSLSISFVRKYP